MNQRIDVGSDLRAGGFLGLVARTVVLRRSGRATAEAAKH
jgi:hypothetical protein